MGFSLFGMRFGDRSGEHAQEIASDIKAKRIPELYTEQEQLPISVMEYNEIWFDRGYQDALDTDRIAGLERAEGTSPEKLQFIEYKIAQIEEDMRNEKGANMANLMDMRDVRDHFLKLAKTEALVTAGLSEEEWSDDAKTEIAERPILDRLTQYLDLDAKTREFNNAWAKTKYAKDSDEYKSWMNSTEEQKTLFETIFTPAEQEMLIKKNINTKKGAASLLKEYKKAA